MWGMPLLTDLALMMRIDPLALIFGLKEFVIVVHGPIVTHVFPDVQVEAYRHSVLYVNLVPVVDFSVLNWVEERELRGLAAEDRLFGRIPEPGRESMDLNNSLKCRMAGENLSNVKENQDTWLAGSDPLPDRCPLYPRIRRMLLGVTSPVLVPRIGAAQDLEKRMLRWSEGMEPRFICCNAAALHTFDFTFLDIWSRKKIKAIPSRKSEVTAGHWNDV